MFTQIKNCIDKVYSTIIADHRSRSEAKYDHRNLITYLTKSELTQEEKNLINQK